MWTEWLNGTVFWPFLSRGLQLWQVTCLPDQRSYGDPTRWTLTVYISIRTVYEEKGPYKRKSQCFKRMLSAMPCDLCATGGTGGKNKEK